MWIIFCRFENTYCNGPWSKKSHSNVTFVTTAVLKRVPRKNLLHPFMKEKSQSNVTFVTTAVHKKRTWINMLQWFMKKRNHSRAIFVTYVESIHVGKKPFKCNTWNNMFKKRIKKMYLFIWKHTYRIVASRSTSRLVTCLGLFRLLMKGIFDPYVLWPFGKKLIFWIVTRVSARDYTVLCIFVIVH